MRLVMDIRTDFITRPVLTPLLMDRRAALAIAGVVGGHFLLGAMGLPGWSCPVRHVLNMPCPGCGLTRATYLLLHGEWQRSIVTHAFAPTVLLMAALLTLAIVLPQSMRLRGLLWLEQLERRSGIAMWSLLALMGYWLLRLVFFRSALFSLVM